MAFDAFLKIDAIPGDSTDLKHKGEIEVLAFSWNIKQTPAETGGGAGAGKAQVSDFSIVKKIDAASPRLFVAVRKGKHFPEALFTVESGSLRQGRAGRGQSFYKVTFSDILITSVAPSGGGSEINEQVSLNFSKVEIEYGDDRGGSKQSVCDFEKGTAE